MDLSAVKGFIVGPVTDPHNRSFAALGCCILADAISRLHGHWSLLVPIAAGRQPNTPPHLKQVGLGSP